MSIRSLLASAAFVAFAAAAPAPSVAAAQPAPAAGAATAPADLKLFPDSKMEVGDRFSVEVVGKGPDIVLIPGLASTRETWRRTAERLRGRYRLHLIQVAGFGGESARANASGPVLAPTAEAIDAYIVEQKLNKPLVIGHSLGGTTALYLVEKHPDHIGRILVVDALPFLPVLVAGPSATVEQIKPMAEAMRTQMAKLSPEARASANRQTVTGMVTAPADVDRVAGWGAKSDGAVVAQAMADDMTLDLRPDLGKIITPVTLIYPFDAKMGVPLERWDGIYQSQYAPLKGAKLVRIDDSRHFVMFDQPAKFDAAVDAWLKG